MLNSLILILSLAWAAKEPIIEEGAHCVAYRAQKTMFLFKSDEVIGKNCDISAQVLPEIGGLYHIEVNVPVRSFDSGDSDRDKDVIDILKGQERAELTFKTKAMNADQWRELFKQGAFALDGELFIGSQSFPLKMQAHYSEKSESAEVDGMIQAKFEDVGLRPPKVGGGLIAKAKPNLELYFRLTSARILGADSLRLGKK